MNFWKSQEKTLLFRSFFWACCHQWFRDRSLPWDEQAETRYEM